MGARILRIARVCANLRHTRTKKILFTYIEPFTTWTVCSKRFDIFRFQCGSHTNLWIWIIRFMVLRVNQFFSGNKAKINRKNKKKTKSKKVLQITAKPCYSLSTAHFATLNGSWFESLIWFLIVRMQSRNVYFLFRSFSTQKYNLSLWKRKKIVYILNCWAYPPEYNRFSICLFFIYYFQCVYLYFVVCCFFRHNFVDWFICFPCVRT